MSTQYKISFVILIILSQTKLFSQSNYFQQEVNYKINVTLNDSTNTLTAFEEIEYINNSPDTLTKIYFHLYPNAYKNNKTAYVKQKLESKNSEIYYSKNNVRGYIDSLNFKINDKLAKWKLTNNIDVAILYLNNPLYPNEKIKITTPFFVKIPNTFSRLGTEKQTYQITQWYPKPAVYDKTGWHHFPYYDIGEFYSEFGSFDVSITLPENYVVGATGNLQTPSEIEFLEKKVEETKNKKDFPQNEKIPKSSEKQKTIRYTEKNIHDFAWFADKQFNVIKSSVTLPQSFKKVTTWLMFPNNEAKLWLNAAEYINDAIKYYSLWNGDYPYNNCTAVHSALSAGGGMEYPTITVIGNTSNKLGLESVIMHEVGHNWFYGVLGFNERDFPWLDEGINSFNELRYLNTKYPKNELTDNLGIANLKAFGLNFPAKYFYYLTYSFSALRNTDQPANLTSNAFSDINYGTIVYHKVAFAFNYLYNYLGEEKFDAIMQKFFQEWKFKHPQPENLQAIFEQETGENLSWFFSDIIASKKKYDYKISKLTKKDSTYVLKIKQKGDFSAPVFYSLFKDNEIIETNKTFFPEKIKNITILNPNFDKITIDAELNSLDLNRNNNSIRQKGLFKKANALKISFLAGVDKPDDNEIYYFPIIGFNNYNKFLTGIMLYSNPIFIKKFEYRIAPMFGWGNKQFAGSSRFAYNIMPYNGLFNNISLKLNADQYSLTDEKNWQKLSAGINFNFTRKNYRNATAHHIEINSVYASNSLFLLYGKSPDYNEMNTFVNINWEFLNNRMFNPFSLGLYANMHKDFTQISAELNYKINYNTENTGLDIRFYAGAFVFNNSNLGIYNISLNGVDGLSDYQYNDIFIGRSENFGNQNFWSQQMASGAGNFAIYSPISSNKWLTALNLKSSLWLKTPLKLYANFATYEGAGKQWNLSKKIAWETGVELTFFSEFLSFYFPFTYSNDIKITNEYYTQSYLERVRFKISFNKLNLFNKIKTVETI